VAVTEVRAEIDIAAPPARVASFAAAFDLAADFHPQIASCHVEGEGVGATRVLFLADGQEIHERLTAESATSYAYEGIRPSRSFASWRGRIEVTPSRRGARVEWVLDFEPVEDLGPGRGLDRVLAEQRGIFEEGLACLARQLEGLD